MSNNNCGCNPCGEITCDPANEPLASALNNFIVAFFGSLTKVCVNNQVVWVLPCDLDSGIAGYPRIAGEGLACYFLRVFQAVSAGALIKVDDNDTTPGNLIDKLSAGTGVVLTILNPAGNEQIEITNTGIVAVSGTDTSPNYLSSKITAGTEISLAVLNPGADEDLEVSYSLPASQAISAADIDWSAGYVFYKTLGANTVFTFSNTQDGKTLVVAITNTAGNFTATWPAAVQWRFGSEPTLTLGAFTDVFTFVNINGTIYGSAVQQFS